MSRTIRLPSEDDISWGTTPARDQRPRHKARRWFKQHIWRKRRAALKRGEKLMRPPIYSNTPTSL
jgi:hypothetical protein